MRQRWTLESTDQVQKIFPHSAWEHTIQAAKVWIKRQCPRKGLSHLLQGFLSSCVLSTTTPVFSHQSFHHCLLAHWSLGLTDSYTERFLGSQVIGLELSHTVTSHGSPICRWPNMVFSAPVTTKSNCPNAALPVNHCLCLHLHPCGP